MDNFQQKLINKRELIFDLDETICTLLIDWSEYKLGMIGKLLETFVDLENTIDADMRSIDIANLVIDIYGRKAKDLINRYSQDYEEKYYFGYEVNQQLVEFIQSNNHLYNMYVWTNNQKPISYLVLKDLNIYHLFKKVVSATDTLFYKPHQEGFKLIKQLTESDLSQFLMIGDSKFDNLAAQNSFIDFFNIRDF